MGRFTLCLVILAITAGAAIAEDKPAKSIDQLIAELDADAPKAREAAQAALIKRGKVARPALEKVLATSKSLEQKSRIKVVLRELLADGGKIVDGLRIRLSIDRTTVKLGQTFTLTTTLQNVTDKPFHVYIGDTDRGTHFTSGLGLTSRELPGGDLQRPANKVYMSSGRNRPLTKLLGKGEEVEFKVLVFVKPMMTFTKAGGRGAGGSQALLELGKRRDRIVTHYGERTFSLDRGVTLRMYSPQDRGERAKVKPDGVRRWTGKLVSNVVKVTIKRR